MKYLFLSQHYTDELLPFLEANVKGSLDYAAHNLCKSIISGLEQNGAEYDVLCVPHVGSFPPLFKKMWIPSSEKQNLESVGYLNVSYIKRWWITSSLKKRVDKWCMSTPGEKAIIFYNFEALCFLPELKKKYPDLKTVSIITDLPQYMPADKSLVTRLNACVNKITKHNRFEGQHALDGYVLLAPKMKDKLPVGTKPWLQIEGIYNDENNIHNVAKSTKKTLIYTGNLGRRYGICELLEAFHRIESKDYELQICGSGDGLGDVLRYASQDSRIKYLGVVPRVKAQELQAAATALVNPRNSDDDYTMYSFPSKTMEYLASGTPVIMSHLKSIPKEYDEHIYYVEDETVDGWTKKIQEICGKSNEELSIFGQNARHFIMSYKTPKPMVEILLRFLENKL